jgi:hypothetical protein
MRHLETKAIVAIVVLVARTAFAGLVDDKDDKDDMDHEGRKAPEKKLSEGRPWSDLLLRFHPCAKPVPGKPGFVFSPFKHYQGKIDVRGIPPGTELKDPYTGEIFLVPVPSRR